MGGGGARMLALGTGLACMTGRASCAVGIQGQKMHLTPSPPLLREGVETDLARSIKCTVPTLYLNSVPQ